LLVPLVTGAMVAVHAGFNGGALTLFVVAAMSLFWLRTPVEARLGTSPIKARTEEERSFVLKTIMGLGLVTAGGISALLWNGHNRGLLAIGAVAAIAFAAQAGVKKLGRSGRMPAQVIGALGLTSTAAGAYYVAAGQFDSIAIALWLGNWLFACNQIHFVQLRIRASRATTLEEKINHGLPFFAGQIVLMGVLVAAIRIGLFPATATLAFLPILLRGTFWFVRGPQALDVHKLGFSELGQAVLFGVLLSATFLV